MPGSSSGFYIGYWCRRELHDMPDGGTKCVTIPDPDGESWELLCEIPGMGKASDNYELATFIVRACNSHAALVAALEEMMHGYAWQGGRWHRLHGPSESTLHKSQAALASAKQ